MTSQEIAAVIALTEAVRLYTQDPENVSYRNVIEAQDYLQSLAEGVDSDDD